MRNTAIVRLFILGVSLLLFSISFPVSGQTTHNVPTDFLTIQAAINAAAAGDTIIIAAGTYTGLIDVNKQLTIEGAGTTTIIQAPTTGSGNVVRVRPAATGTILRNLQIQNGARGINLDGGADNITIEGVTSTGNYTAGINIANSNGVTIRNSSFSNNLNANVPPTGGSGLRLGTGDRVENLLIEDSHFDGNYQGVYVAANNPLTSFFRDVIIRRTTFNDNHIKGMYIEKASNILFEEIEVDNSGHHPTYIHNAGIDFNLLHGTFSNIVIRDSIITNSGHRNNALIFKARQGYTGGGIPAPGTNSSLQDVTIENTQIINNPNTGIVFGGEGEPIPNTVITGSHIYGNGTGLTSWIPTITATNNWWGCNDPSDPTAGCDSITGFGSVDYSNHIVLGSSITQISGGTCQLDLNFTQNVNGVPVPVTWRDGLSVALSIADGTIAPSATFSGGMINQTFTAPEGVPTTITAVLDGEQLVIPLTCGTLPITPTLPPVVPTTSPTTDAPSADINVFDPAISKIGLLLPGDLGLAGERLEWVTTVSNRGGASGFNVVITDTLRPELQIDSVNAPGGTVTINGQTVTVTYAEIAPAQVYNFSIFTTVLQSDVVMDNTVCLTANNSGNICATGYPAGNLPATGETPLWAEIIGRWLNR